MVKAGRNTLELNPAACDYALTIACTEPCRSDPEFTPQILTHPHSAAPLGHTSGAANRKFSRRALRSWTTQLRRAFFHFETLFPYRVGADHPRRFGRFFDRSTNPKRAKQAKKFAPFCLRDRSPVPLEKIRFLLRTLRAFAIVPRKLFTGAHRENRAGGSFFLRDLRAHTVCDILFKSFNSGKEFHA